MGRKVVDMKTIIVEEHDVLVWKQAGLISDKTPNNC